MTEASTRQNQAARPDMNTWLAANAGSGKTRVLTDRVARLLLGGADPQKILCLTYTKAAAGEMQNRLFRRLGDWAMLEDGKLRQALISLGVSGNVSNARLRQARTLFAKAIETPGGLKIQTIHSFCASVLRRFPLEAGVSPAFTEMDDRTTTLLRQDVLNDMASGADRDLVSAVCRHVTEQKLQSLVASVCSNRSAFETPFDPAAVRKTLGLAQGDTDGTIIESVFLGGENELIEAVAQVLATQGPRDSKTAAALRRLTPCGARDLPDLEALFLYGEKTKNPFCAKTDSFPTKSGREALGGLLGPLHEFMIRVELARPKRLGLAAYKSAELLHKFASTFLSHMEARKRSNAWLDFDDLIRITKRMLTTPGVSEWVLFRLDGGIDHVLVDEAQDTSPDQWSIVEALVGEFTSGESAAGSADRTLFVVGDRKQSIYSFQGADPAEFDRMRSEFRTRFRQVGSDLQDLTLEFSFRSSEAILRLVDLVFSTKASSGFKADSLHRAFKSEMPGRVDLWPVIPVVRSQDEGHWTDALDKPAPRHQTRIMAERIADNIQQMLDTGETIPIDGAKPGSFERRAVKAGDILILLQSRSVMFHEIIRACKSRSLPIAGADRLRVGAELAVRDLASLLRFVATPEDNLSLAETLRSPLFGWSEQDLFDVAHKRTEPFLWQALRNRRDEFEGTLHILDDLRREADFLRPYELVERILTRHRGRQALISRLGPEAEDGIDAMLSQALAYEQVQVPSLTGFLVWMDANDLEIKRQSDTSGDLIRIMTVHGAKGLEAPIVILPDTAKRRIPDGADILKVDGVPFWRPAKADMPEALRESWQDERDAQQMERDRLLYVALTRAEKWLIVAAAGNIGDVGESWYADVAEAMVKAGALETEMPGGPGFRLSHLDWHGVPLAEPSSAANPETRADPEPIQPESVERPQILLNPSELGGAKALSGEAGRDTQEATLRGTLIHRLLEHLPAVQPADREEVSRLLLPEAADPSIIEEVVQLLRIPELEFLFAPATLAEVPIAARLGSGRMLGVIDRLVVAPNRVLAVDFKSNMVVPEQASDCPEGILRQMGAYACALQQVYPGRTVETAIVWTRTARLMPLPHDLVTEALARTGWVDANETPS